MLALKGRQDRYRLLLPDKLIPREIVDKYTKVLREHHSFIYSPIDYVSESIQKIQVLGFNDGTIDQHQTRRGYPLIKQGRTAENNFLHTAGSFPYRSPAGPESLIDRTLNVDFRMNSGFLNYFILFESFFYQHTRDREYDDLPDNMYIEIMNQYGDVYARIVLSHPLINGMDMLDLDFSQPVAASQTFRVIFKYSDFDFEFIESDAVTFSEDLKLATREDIPGFNIEEIMNDTYYEVKKNQSLKDADTVNLIKSREDIENGGDGLHDKISHTDNLNAGNDPSDKLKGGIYIPNT